MSWQSEMRAWAVASAAAFCLGSIGYRVWTAPKIPDLAPTVARINAVTDNMNATVDAINRPCGGGKPCGLLADTAKTLGTLRLTAGQLELAANHEDKRIGILDAQEERIASDTHTVLVTLNGTVKGIQPIESEVTDEVRALELATDKLDALLADPNLTSIAGNLNQVSVNLAGVTDNANKITKDAADEVHALTHPPKKSFWRAVFAVVHAAEPPIF